MKQRILAFIIDMLLITLFIMLPAYVSCFLGYPLLILALFGLLVTCFLSKDCFNGQSIGKRLMKIQVVDRQTGNPVSNIRLMIRNLSLVVWKIEALILIITKEKRLGDMLAKTKVIHQSNRQKIRFDFNLFISLVLCYVVSIIIVPICFFSSTFIFYLLN